MTRDTNEWLHGTRSSCDSSRFQLVKNFPEFYATWNLIAVYTSLCCFIPCELDEPILRHRFLYKIRFLFTQTSMSRSSMWAVSFIFVPPSSLYAFLCSLHMQLALPSSSLLIWSPTEYLFFHPPLRPTYCSPQQPVFFHPHRSSCKPTQFAYTIIIMYILILMFFIWNGKTER